MSKPLKQRLGHVPRRYAGKWIACTPDGKSILGSGETLDEARRAAETNGMMADAHWSPNMGLAYEWVPFAESRFIGNPRV